MLKPHGYATIIDPNFSGPTVGGVQEHDTLMCIHCARIDMTKSRLSGKYEVIVFKADGTHYTKEAGFCRNCMAPICPRCIGKPCDNRFKRLEAEENLANKLIARREY